MPSERTRLARAPGAPPWWLAAVAAAVLIVTSVQVAGRGWLTDLDSRISRHVLDLHLPGQGAGHDALYALTWFGQRAPVLVVSAVLIAYFTWRARTSEPALRYVLALVLLTAVVYALKYGIPRTAPSWAPGKADPKQSFPSGHMANAVLIWGVVAWAAQRAVAPPRLRWLLRAVWAVAPVAVFVAMTLLNYHWFSDFLAGACVGVLLLPVVLHPAWSRPARWLDRRLWRPRIVGAPGPSAKLTRS